MPKFDDREVGDRSKRGKVAPLLTHKHNVKHFVRTSKQKAFLDLSLSQDGRKEDDVKQHRIGTLVIDVLDADAPIAAQHLITQLSHGCFIGATIAALEITSRVEIQPAQSLHHSAPAMQMHKEQPLPYEADGSAPPAHDQRGVVSVNAHDGRLLCLFDSTKGLDRDWRACGYVSEGFAVLEALRQLAEKQVNRVRVDACGVLNTLSTDGASLTAARERARLAAADAEERRKRAKQGMTSTSHELQAEHKRVRSEVCSAVSSALGADADASPQKARKQKRQRVSYMDPLDASDEEDDEDEEDEERNAEDSGNEEASAAHVSVNKVYPSDAGKNDQKIDT